MRHLTSILFLLLIGLMLSACSKAPTVAVTQLNSTPLSAPQQTSNNKFALGPHNGLLGMRRFYFDCSSTLLPPKYNTALNAQAKYLLSHPNAKIQLQGFTRAKGSHEYNIVRGQKRADSLVHYLKLKMVLQAQLASVSLGGELAKPSLGSNNCRVDLIYIKD